MGLSDNILTLIERRSRADLVIFFAMAVLTLVFIYFLAYYVKTILTFDHLVGMFRGAPVAVPDPEHPLIIETL